MASVSASPATDFARTAQDLSRALKSLSQTMKTHNAAFEGAVPVLCQTLRLVGGADVTALQDMSRFPPDVQDLTRSLRHQAADDLRSVDGGLDRGATASSLQSSLLDHYDTLNRLNRGFERLPDIEQEFRDSMNAAKYFTAAVSSLPDADKIALSPIVGDLVAVMGTAYDFASYSETLQERFYDLAEKSVTNLCAALTDAAESPENYREANKAFRALHEDSCALMASLAPAQPPEPSDDDFVSFEDTASTARPRAAAAAPEKCGWEAQILSRPDASVTALIDQMATSLSRLSGEKKPAAPTAPPRFPRPTRRAAGYTL